MIMPLPESFYFTAGHILATDGTVDTGFGTGFQNGSK